MPGKVGQTNIVKFWINEILDHHYFFLILSRFGTIKSKIDVSKYNIITNDLKETIQKTI
jgi:hypothetical protein